MSTLPDLGPNTSGPVFPKGWDRVELNGSVLPGLCRITKGGITYRLDKKQASGKKGSKTTNKGPEVQEIEVECVVWTNAQRDELVRQTKELRRIIGTKPDKAVFPFAAPAVADLDVKNVMVKHISPLLDHEKGRKRTFLLQHWEKPKDTGGTPTKPTDAAGQIANARRQVAEVKNPRPRTQSFIASPTGAKPPEQDKGR